MEERGSYMTKCDFCGRDIEKIRRKLGYDLPFTCKYCGGNFCSDHRLPENHNCTKLPEGWAERVRFQDEKYRSPEIPFKLAEREGMDLEEKIKDLDTKVDGIHNHDGRIVIHDDDGNLWIHGRRHSLSRASDNPIKENTITPISHENTLRVPQQKTTNGFIIKLFFQVFKIFVFSLVVSSIILHVLGVLDINTLLDSVLSFIQ